MRVQLFCKAAALALFCVPVAACDRLSGGEPKLVMAEALGDKPDPEVRAFYEARGWQAAWDGKSEKALLQALDEATAHGLNKELFLKGELPEERMDRETALTKAALRYASALARGYADPAKMQRVYTLPRSKPKLTDGLAKAVEEGQVEEWLASLAPQTDEYRALSQAFVQFLHRANTARATPVGEGKAIKPGKSDERIPAVVSSLVANGYLDAPQGPPPRSYTPAMVAAVKQLQADQGLEPDGVIGSATVEALNRSPADRARQLAVNLERRRWLRREPPETRVDVNTAAASLDYWRNGRHSDRRNVVVGQPDWETPELASPMIQLVAHPYWRVPDSILEDELAGKSAAYFASQQMEWRNGRLVQLPGPKNALGEVKFDMRNGQHIYLHDTPAKALFDTPERHRSHGCVRVEDALGFALLVARDDGVLPKFQEALMAEDESYVKLRTEIPVRLMYHTAFLDGGAVRLVEDVYGWDDDVARALGYVRPTRVRRAHARGADVGP